jgi:DNA repair photolyase
MSQQVRGRGAGFNPPNRFERLQVEPLEDLDGERSLPTQYFVDSTKSILAENDSPDVPFTFSINPYRGCEHGCIYCYARASHEYLGFSAGLDFESRILVKPDAPRLLEEAFRRRTWKPQPVALSGNTDCYQPVERRLELTRKCLGVFLAYRNPVSIITKSHLITRDVDLLTALADLNLVRVHLSITTLDPELARAMEPRAATPSRRLEAIRTLSERGIPTGVTAAPLVPGLTDQELPAILEAAADCGARTAAYILLRLPYSVEILFLDWLHREFPRRASKVINRLKAVRGGKLSSSDFETRMQGEGKLAGSIRDMFEIFCRKNRLNQEPGELATNRFVRPGTKQLALFGR